VDQLAGHGKKFGAVGSPDRTEMSEPGAHCDEPVLDLRGTGAPVPHDLTTGCFVPNDKVPGTGACEGRATRAGLNKDNGLVDPGTGTATAPTTRHRTAAAESRVLVAPAAPFSSFGRKPPQRRNAGRFLIAATASGTAGAAAAWGIRHSMDLRRTVIATDGSAPRVP
jgi:hypothetical protein